MSDTEPSSDICAGCGASDPRATDYGLQCPRCEVMLRRYNYSRDELKAFVVDWLKRWEAVGLPPFEAYEHLKSEMLSVGRTICPELGMG